METYIYLQRIPVKLLFLEKSLKTDLLEEDGLIERALYISDGILTLAL